jgi:hypothetical protein
MARFIDAQTDPQRKWNSLRQFANDISRLRRSTLADDYLQIQRDWLALSQSNTAEKKEKQFWNWTKRPDIEKKLFPDRRPGLTPEQLYQFEKDCCLLDGPGPEIAELMAEVRIAKKLLELRKAQEIQTKAKADPDYDPDRPLPDSRVRLAGMAFETLFPTIPETPLTETHPELDDAIEDSDPSTDDGTPSSNESQPQSHSSHSSHSHPSQPSDVKTQERLDTNPKPADADFPLASGEGWPEGQETVHPLPAHDQNTAPSDQQGNPAVPPSPSQSDPVQPNPTTPPPDPDVTM